MDALKSRIKKKRCTGVRSLNLIDRKSGEYLGRVSTGEVQILVRGRSPLSRCRREPKVFRLVAPRGTRGSVAVIVLPCVGQRINVSKAECSAKLATDLR